MIRSIGEQLARRIERLPAWAILVPCAAAIVAAGAVSWSISRGGPPAAPEAPSTGARHAFSDGSNGPAPAGSIPAGALTVTLIDELFPERRPAEAPPPEAPPPRLSLELKAILDEGGSRRAFLYDSTSQQYLELAVGESAPGGALLTAIDGRACEFKLGGHRVTLELPR